MKDLNDYVDGNELQPSDFNEIPSEIQQAITDSGQTLSSGDLTQLSKATSANVANKAAAVLLTPVNNKMYFIGGTDGGLFKGVTGAAAATYSDNGGSYCGTQFIPTGGDGSAAWVRVDGGYNVGLPFNVVWFGAQGDGVTEDHVAIQAALDAAASDTSAIHRTYAPAGKYIIGDTVYLPELLDFFGEGVSILTSNHSTRMQAKSGLEKDMFRVIPHFSGGLYWWGGHVYNMDIRGDRAGTLGSGISLKDSSSNTVIAEDGALLNNLIIEDMAESGIVLPSGAIPLHIRDVRVTDVGDYGIDFTGLALTVNGLHLDNISGDNCTNGLVRLKDLDYTSNVLLTNIKAEGKAATQNYTLIIDNCDRASITIDSGHMTSAEPDGAFFKAPKDFIRISGVGAPIITWSGYSPRIRTTDTEVDTSYVLNDTISGKTIHSSQRNGRYNTINARRFSNSGATISNGAGSNAQQTMSGTDAIALGDLVAATQIADMEDVFMGEAYTSSTDIIFRRQNVSGVDFTYSIAYLTAFKVPMSYVRTSASKTFDPPSITANTSTSTTVTVPTAELGDFVMYSHAADQTSTVGTSYVSSADTVTIHWTAVGTTRDIPSGELTAYVLKESAFSLMGAITYDPPSINNAAQAVSTAITVKGAALGDIVISSFSLDLQGIKMSAYVSAADTIEVIFLNYTGGVIDLASGVLRVGILNTAP